MNLEYTSIEREPYIWHWVIKYTEVSNNYYVVTALGPKGEKLRVDGPNDPSPLIAKMVNTIMQQSPEQDKQKYTDYKSRIVDKVYYMKETVYRLDISFV